MSDRSQILEAVYIAVANTNQALPDDGKIVPKETSLINGARSKLDSLAFVSLMVSIEQEVESVAGSCPSLVEVFSDPASEISTLGEIVDFIVNRV